MAHKSHSLTTTKGPVTINWVKTRRFLFSRPQTIFNLKNFSSLGLIFIAFGLVIIFALALKYLENSLNRISWSVMTEAYAAATNNDLRAEFIGTELIRFPIVVAPAEIIKTQLTFKNTGTATWQNSKNPKETGLILTSTSNNAFHPSWLNKNIVAKINNPIKKGESVSVPVTFYAPVLPGSYTYTFELKRNNLNIPGSLAKLEIKISNNPAERTVPSATPLPVALDPVNQGTALAPTSQNPFTITNASVAWIGTEPKIRIGLTTASPHTITADTTFFITDQANLPLYTFGAGTLVIINYNGGNYKVTTPGQEIILTTPVRFEASGGILQIPSHTRARSNNLIYNVYRGALEIRYIPESGNLWAINELPLEQYLAGVRETSNTSQTEYLKTMTVAARSYALYHLLRNKKYALGKFHLTSTDADQVYKGYLSELEMPNLVSATSITYGQVVTYDNRVAVTPYFSRGNGQTKAHPTLSYVQAVTTPATAGSARWGHGYGIDATDAITRAKNGAPYYDIIRYYFQGINLERVY